MSLHQLARDGEVAFRILSHSLAAYGVHSGDVVILGKHALAAGQKVLASLNGRLLIGQVWESVGAQRVVLANQSEAVIEIAERDEFQVLGVVNGVVRQSASESCFNEEHS